MFEITVYIFYVLLFSASGELSYTIFRTGVDSSNLKLKIGGTIELPVLASDSEHSLRTPADARAVLRTPNETSSEQESPRKPASGSNESNATNEKVTRESDHSNTDTDTSRESKEKPASDENVQETAVKRLGMDNSTEVKPDKVRNSKKDKHLSTPKKKPDAAEQKIPHKPVFLTVSPALRTAVTTAIKKPKAQKVMDDDRIRTFSSHVYKQALKVFEAMKQKSDPYTQTKINELAEMYKEKFKDFVHRTRQTSLKTNEGAQNAILHTIDTSNLIMERIVNFLKTDTIGTNALRHGGVSRLQKELDTLKTAEFEHACKTFGICRSAQGFRYELQNIISTLLSLPDSKLLQANDAATEILKAADLSAFSHSNPIQDLIKKYIKRQEKADADTLRSHLEILFGVLSKSHQPLIVDTQLPFEMPAVKRTVSFHSLVDALEEALPPNEFNKKEWSAINNRLKRWKDGGTVNVQETFESLFNNVEVGVKKYEGAGRIREAIRDIVMSIGDDD